MPKKDMLFLLMIFAAVMGIFNLVSTINYFIVDFNLEAAALSAVTTLLYLLAAYGMFRWNSVGWYAFVGAMGWSVVLQVLSVFQGGFSFYKLGSLGYVLLYIFIIIWMMDPEVKRNYIR